MDRHDHNFFGGGSSSLVSVQRILFSVILHPLIPYMLSSHSPVLCPKFKTAELACSNEDLSTLCFLLGEYNLTEALSGGQWTAFGPTNSAFEAIESVLPSLSDETISNILLFHTISDRVVTRAELECRGLQEMTTGEDSRTVCRDGRLYQKGAGNSDDMLPEIILGDLPACNGVVYVVDNVMLPQI